MSLSSSLAIAPNRTLCGGFVGYNVRVTESPSVPAAVGALPSAADLLAAIVEGSDDVIMAKRLDGTIISWNPAAERLFGYSAQEALGQHVGMLIPDDHQGEDDVVMQRILEGGSVQHYETERLTRTGRRVPVSLTVSPIRSRDGAVIGASKIMRDISTTRTARITEERLAAIVESSDDAIVSKDINGIITSWNPSAQRMFGYTAGEAIGQHVSLLFPEHLRGNERDILGEILQGRKVDHYETVRLTRDGRMLDVSLTVSPVRDDDGTVVGASKIIRDITQHKRLAEHARQAEELAAANEQLAAADRLKDQFLAMANHEMRTPLTSIGGFTRTMLDLEDRFGPAERRGFLEIISEQTDRLTRMVDDMLMLGRIELGTFDVQPADVAILEAARHALRGVGRSDVVVHGDDALLARVDPHHFDQMLLNYVDNAHKYGAGAIDVDITVDADDAIQVRVRDEGAGVNPAFEAHLFDRFTRSDEHASSTAPGVGLGLSIVRGLARAQGGEAWYEPRQPNGSQFCLRLPRA
ncbi:MAG: domain S-box-containing protein [Thermoleophilia bacterium]|nr:domain S-box-containing protein [Thermoleophilia bacterium]